MAPKGSLTAAQIRRALGANAEDSLVKQILKDRSKQMYGPFTSEVSGAVKYGSAAQSFAQNAARQSGVNEAMAAAAGRGGIPPMLGPALPPVGSQLATIPRGPNWNYGSYGPPPGPLATIPGTPNWNAGSYAAPRALNAAPVGSEMMSAAAGTNWNYGDIRYTPDSAATGAVRAATAGADDMLALGPGAAMRSPVVGPDVSYGGRSWLLGGQSLKQNTYEAARGIVKQAGPDGVEKAAAAIAKGTASAGDEALMAATEFAGTGGKASTFAKWALTPKALAGAGGAIAGISGSFLDDSDLLGGRTSMANDVASGALKGAGYGAGIGSFIPGVGTALGAGVGGIVGAGLGWFGNDDMGDIRKQALKNFDEKTIGYTQLPGDGLDKTGNHSVPNGVPQEVFNRYREAYANAASDPGSYDNEEAQAQLNTKFFGDGDKMPGLLGSLAAQQQTAQAGRDSDLLQTGRMMLAQKMAQDYMAPYARQAMQASNMAADTVGAMGPKFAAQASMYREQGARQAAALTEQASVTPAMFMIDQERARATQLEERLWQSQLAAKGKAKSDSSKEV